MKNHHPTAFSHHPNGHRTLWRFAVPLTVAAALSACNKDWWFPPSIADTAVISGVVADGPLLGATVCLDINANGVCDGSEPMSSATDADGRYRFEVPADAAGRYAIVAQVPADAIDRDTGRPVGTAFTLKAPPTGVDAAQSVFVSPLTTMVAELAAVSQITPVQAAEQVRVQLGLTQSPLADFVQSQDPVAAVTAATIARVIVEIQSAANSVNVPIAQTQALLVAATVNDLPSIAARVASVLPEASGLTPAQVVQAATQAATQVVAATGITAETVAAQASVAREVASTPAETVPAEVGPFVSVRNFTYTDAQNYTLRLFVGDSTRTDADSAFLADEVRMNRSNGQAPAFNRNTVYWTGNDWFNCPSHGVGASRTQSQTATVPQRSLYCNASKSESRIARTSIAGQRMADVVTQMRAFPLKDGNNGLPTNWGPSPALLGDAVFPAGSQLTTREQRGEVGNTDRFSLTDKPRIIPASGTGSNVQVATLDELKRMSGNLANAGTTPSHLNSLFLDNVPIPQPSDATLTAFARYRVALDPASSAARFYRCNVKLADDTSVGCETIGSGTWSISSQGNARVMRLATGYPEALISEMARQRIWVEHTGVVFGGYTDLQRTTHHQRLNTTAWVALRDRLGIPVHTTPTAPASTGETFILRRFTFTDANNFFGRVFSGNTSNLDAQGYATLGESVTNVVNGVVTPVRRNALYWTGTQWYACPDAAVDDSDAGTPVLRANSRAPFDSVFCNAYRDQRETSLTMTLDGRNMADVVRDIRRYPSLDGTFRYSGWGPNPDAPAPNVAAAALASNFFSAGSTMELRAQRRLATPVVISTNDSSKARVPPAGNPSAPFANWPFAANLEAFVAANPGDWAGGSLNGSTAFWVHEYDITAPAGSGYTNREQIRVSFEPGSNRARFYRNNLLTSNGATTNYQVIGDTTYSIVTLGDARVLQFASMPGDFRTRFVFERMFAERGGEVRYAFKDVDTGLAYSVRLNESATVSLARALGID